MEEKEKVIKQLYDVAIKSDKSEPPKRGLFSTKCPKCGSKLGKGSEKMLIVTGEAGSEFANEVAAHFGLAQGAYNLSIDHYKCPCGYEFARALADALSD